MECSKLELLLHARTSRKNETMMIASKLVIVLLVFYIATRYDQSQSFHCYAFIISTTPIPLKAFSNELLFISSHQIQGNKAVLLYSVNKNNDKTDSNTDQSYNDKNNLISRISMMNPILVYTDIFAILIACQLMGLLDVLNDSTFWMNGGWFQPITFVSTESATLPIFVQRVANNTVLYLFIACIFVQGNYAITTALESSKSILRMMMLSITMFTFARIGISFIYLFVLTQPVSLADFMGSTTSHSDVFIETLRESYFMAITMASGRLGLYKMFNGS